MRKNIFLFVLLIGIVTVSQFILARKQLELGFFTDDWLFLSAYRVYVSNPITDLFEAWKSIGSHNFSHAYYIGILYNFFGLDYFAYRFTNEILKIIACLSVYPVVLILFKRKLLAFLSTLIYAIHFSSFGLLDGPSRGEDFIAIIFMNLFLLGYFYSLRKNLSIKLLMLLSIFLSFVIFVDATRLFPLLGVIFLVEILYLTRNISHHKALISLKRLLIFYFPYLLALIITPEAILPQLTYIQNVYNHVARGNWQLILVPMASFGSMFITKEFWSVFIVIYNKISTNSIYLFIELFIFFSALDTLVAFLVIKKPLKFILHALSLNLIFTTVAFLIVDHYYFIDKNLASPIDPATYSVPALIGLFFLSLIISFAMEWCSGRQKSVLYLGLFIAPILSFLFVFMTWMFADINSVFLSVHPYLGIPAIGISIFMAIILILVCDRLKSIRSVAINRFIAPAAVALFIGIFFVMSYISVDQYFSHWIKDGMLSSDQQRIMDKFWSYVKFDKQSNQDIPPLIYLDTSGDYDNGAFYSETIIWRLSSWFDLKYFKPKEGRYSLCIIMIIDKPDLLNSVATINGEKKITRSKCGPTIVYDTENFYAFKLQNRDLYPIKTEVLRELGVE